MKRELITTADGSHTLYVPELNEHYHSTNGAFQEALHVFIEAGFRQACTLSQHRPLHILEIGFGTGLNALLTFWVAEKERVGVCYEALEKYPLTAAEIQQLNYSQLLPAGSRFLFESIHQAVWNTEASLTDCHCEEQLALTHRESNQILQRVIHKKTVDLLEYQPDKLFDLIYFDAFAPTIQPELWGKAVFQKLYNALRHGGILVTYSSKGSVKEALRSVGFQLERLPGAAGKRHMLRATKAMVSD